MRGPAATDHPDRMITGQGHGATVSTTGGEAGRMASDDRGGRSG
jgi:hypothetical protein